MNYFQFKRAVQQYQHQTGAEISNYAIRFNYHAYINGQRTALVNKMTKTLGSEIEKCCKRPVEFANKTQIKYRKSFENIDHLILDPALNAPKKVDTYTIAKKNGKEYFIAKCKHHGITLFRVRQGEEITGCCASCKYGPHATAIQKAAKDFLAKLQLPKKI